MSKKIKFFLSLRMLYYGHRLPFKIPIKVFPSLLLLPMVITALVCQFSFTHVPIQEPSGYF